MSPVFNCENAMETSGPDPGFLFSSPKVIIMVERKGQTRNWLIIASLSTQVSLFDLFCGSLKEIVQYDVALK